MQRSRFGVSCDVQLTPGYADFCSNVKLGTCKFPVKATRWASGRVALVFDRGGVAAFMRCGNSESLFALYSFDAQTFLPKSLHFSHPLAHSSFAAVQIGDTVFFAEDECSGDLVASRTGHFAQSTPSPPAPSAPVPVSAAPQGVNGSFRSQKRYRARKGPVESPYETVQEEAPPPLKRARVASCRLSPQVWST